MTTGDPTHTGDDHTGDGWRLLVGDYRDRLASPASSFGAMITDPPYAARVHRGHDYGVQSATTFATVRRRRELKYQPMDENAARELVAWSHRHVAGWIVIICDHISARWYEAALDDVGRYVFAPIVWYSRGSRFRVRGDGPTCWSTWIVVARPRCRPWSSWGSLPGGYEAAPDRGQCVVGAKPLPLMRAIVRDYTRPGEHVVDPFAGGGSTLAAAICEGRVATGCELDASTATSAAARIARDGVRDLFAPRPAAACEQLALMPVD